MRKLITTVALTAACVTGAAVSPHVRHYSQPGSVSASRGFSHPKHTTSIVLATRTWVAVPNTRGWPATVPALRVWP